MSSFNFVFFTCTKSDWDVLAWILFWVFSSKRLGCPRWNFVLSLYRATRVSSLELSLKFVRSDWSVLAGILFWAFEKRLGCPRWSFVLSLQEATGVPSLNEFFFEFVRGDYDVLTSVPFTSIFLSLPSDWKSGLKFYFLVLFHSTGISSLNFYC